MPQPSIPPIEVVALGADAIYLSRRPLPKAPDGHYDWQNQEDSSASTHAHSGVANLIHTIETIESKKGSIIPPPHVIDAYIDMALHPDSVDDRKGAFTGGLDIIAKLPADASVAKKMSNVTISMLYNTLPHPRAALLGEVHSFRRADGGGNNLQVPDMGKAGTAYARSVQGKHCNAPTSLPDPGLIFDTLLKARDRKDHPGGQSSITFAFATLVTHSLFRSDFTNWNINATSSYLDLSPLYGINQQTQDLVRDKAPGRGLLKPDSFSEERLMFLPPAASVILVLLSRNHNYIADKLLKINERGKWTDPPPEDETKRAKQDEEIFQTARLVNCGHFMGLIMSDYVTGFLGLSEGNAWSMPAFDIMKQSNGVELERGVGNHCSVEFNLLYRWHHTLSAADQQWTENIFNEAFDNKPFDQITMQDFGRVFGKAFATIDPDPSQRSFAGLKRGPDGKFSDDDLARLMLDATESPAGAYRGRGTPECMRIIEVMGMLQARQWGVCTMNEFREFLGLKQFNDFEDWCSDPSIVAAARRLYGHVDNLELYPGLQCEDTMPLTPGYRLGASYTVTRAILADAIALVRGDRFYTSDFTAANLTTWGYQDCVRDPHNGGLGGELPRLLTRHLPRHYPYNSVYTCFPFFTPQKMKASLSSQGVADSYAFERPAPLAVPIILDNYTAIDYVFKDPARFPPLYDMKGLGGGYALFFNSDKSIGDTVHAQIMHAMFPSANSISWSLSWYRETVTQLIKERSWKYDGVQGTYVDIVKSVINVAVVHWVAERLVGLPLKTKENPGGMYTEQEVYDMLATLFHLIFLGIGDNEHGFSLRYAAMQAGGVIQGMTMKSILEISPQSASSAVTGLIGHVTKFFWPPNNKPCYPFISTLAATGRPMDELAPIVVGLSIASSVTTAQAAVHVIDFYLDDARAAERAKMIKLAQSDDSQSMALFTGYVREGMRFNPQFSGLWRGVAVDASIPQGDGQPPLNVKAGDRIWGSFRNANQNETTYPNPTAIDPTRPRASYRVFGAGFNACPGASFAEQSVAEMVKVVFKLKNLRRAAGDAGKLSGFTEVVNETSNNVYISPYGTTGPWPGSMHLVYEA